MNETTIDLDQTDEEILTHDVSDEALEAAGTVQGGRMQTANAAVVTCYNAGWSATFGSSGCGCAGEGSMS
jgi:hypothetical protein